MLLSRGRAIVVLLLVAAAWLALTLVHASGAGAAASFTQRCSDPFPSSRTPGNPLMLSPAPPRSNPLAGASFVIAGPAHGSAAGAIAQLLGIDKGVPVGKPLPSFKESESWATFAKYVSSHIASVSGSTRHKIQELEKIASEPQTERISKYSEGGTPAGIYSQAQKLFCHNFTADPNAIPVISTYFLHATLAGCPSTRQIDGYRPAFEAQINALAKATGNRPVVYLLELDAVGSSGCIARHHAMPAWESMLKYEATTLGKLPHTVVYLEGGYSDANSAGYAARILNASGIRQIEGFFTNDTHDAWTSREIAYGEAISAMTGGSHFVIDTAENGHGPLLNPHPVTQGVEALCNPPGRGLGPRPTTSTGFKNVDAFLWTHVPGNSDGSCHGGPPSGDFWPARAISEAEHANGKLGPGHPSLPY